MLFLVTYQVDRDKQVECQTFFANMTNEQIENESAVGMTCQMETVL